jgi:hypothetical protein
MAALAVIPTLNSVPLIPIGASGRFLDNTLCPAFLLFAFIWGHAVDSSLARGDLDIFRRGEILFTLGGARDVRFVCAGYDFRSWRSYSDLEPWFDDGSVIVPTRALITIALKFGWSNHAIDESSAVVPKWYRGSWEMVRTPAAIAFMRG